MKTYLLLLHLVSATYKKKKKYLYISFNTKNNELSQKLIKQGILKGCKRKGSTLLLLLKYNNGRPALKYLSTTKGLFNQKVNVFKDTNHLVTGKNYLYLNSKGLFITNQKRLGKLLAVFY
jgi:hypothetical protein